jgi:hypothetical protein
MIKFLTNEISYPLEIICNKSMSEGYYPDQFKYAHIIPIHKGKSKHDMNNFRPVSLLCCLSKILEKIIYKRLYGFLEEHNLFNKLQFGFRKKLNTIDAITAFLARLLPNMDKKEHCMGIFIDLSKAFDTIDHTILIYKLNKLGIRGICNEWFKNYLKNRSQSVRLSKDNSNDFILSNTCPIIYGVPQGSILGPLLFTIYILDMPDSISHGIPISFADDTSIFINHSSLEDLYIHAYEDLNAIIDWFNANKLSMNLLKTKYILFEPYLKYKDLHKNSIPELIINGIKIDQVECTSFLGLQLDSKLNWNLHVSKVVNKLRQAMYIFNSTKRILSKYSKKTLYYANVYSHITYGAFLWAPMIKNSQTNTISKLLNKIVSCIMNTKRFNNSAYKELELLKFTDVTKLELGKFMYKLVNKLLPTDIYETVVGRQNQDRHYQTRNRNVPRIAKHTSNLYNNSFLVRSNLVWTQLPEHIKSTTHIKSFKQNFKKLTLSNY